MFYFTNTALVMDFSDIMCRYVKAFKATDQALAINPMNGLFLCGPQGHFLTAEHRDTVTALSHLKRFFLLLLLL